MLSRGFGDQLSDIFSILPTDVQIILCSATMPVEVLHLVNKLMKNPIRIRLEAPELTLEGVRQFYIRVEKEVKFVPTTSE